MWFPRMFQFLSIVIIVREAQRELCFRFDLFQTHPSPWGFNFVAFAYFFFASKTRVLCGKSQIRPCVGRALVKTAVLLTRISSPLQLLFQCSPFSTHKKRDIYLDTSLCLFYQTQQELISSKTYSAVFRDFFPQGEASVQRRTPGTNLL